MLFDNGAAKSVVQDIVWVALMARTCLHAPQVPLHSKSAGRRIRLMLTTNGYSMLVCASGIRTINRLAQADFREWYGSFRIPMA